MEWLEIRNYDGDTAVGQPINVNEGNAGNNFFSHLIIHDYTSSTGRGAINIYENATVRNSIFYNGDVGIRTYSNTLLTLTLENVTIYGMTGDGVFHRDGTLVAKNTISVGNGGQDFDVDNTPDGVVDQVNSGYNLYSTVDGAVHPGSNNQSPPASLEDLFISIAASSERVRRGPTPGTSGRMSMCRRSQASTAVWALQLARWQAVAAVHKRLRFRGEYQLLVMQEEQILRARPLARPHPLLF
jgi:hypothetical protein